MDPSPNMNKVKRHFRHNFLNNHILIEETVIRLIYKIPHSALPNALTFLDVAKTKKHILDYEVSAATLNDVKYSMLVKIFKQFGIVIIKLKENLILNSIFIV